jgi:predicted nucleic-acid-binding Zn-ribbon protein
MPDYNPDSRCPKCGYDTITTKYIPTDCIDRIAAIWGEVKFLDQPKPEHLLRTCVRCGYEWKEEVVTVKEIDVRDEVTLPDGTVIVGGINHWDCVDDQGMYSVRIYKHPDGYRCNREGVHLFREDGTPNWDAMRRGPSSTTDMEMAMEIIKATWPEKEE